MDLIRNGLQGARVTVCSVAANDSNQF